MRYRIFRIIGATGGCALAMCLLGGSAVAQTDGAADTACVIEDGNIHVLYVAPEIVRPGTLLDLQPVQGTPRTGYDDIPMTCIADWDVTPQDIATGDPAENTLRIRDDAPAGAELHIAYRLTGEHATSELAQRTIPIAGAEEVVLTGVRRQAALENCAASEPVRELALSADGGFSVTFVFFSTRRDYWGRYAYDPATGALTFEIEGDNLIPPGIDLSGSARLGDDGRLIIEDIYFGDRAAAPPPEGEAAPAAARCRYIFE